MNFPVPSPPAKELLAANIVMLRARQKMSQSALADLAQISRPTVSNIERAEISTTVEIVEKLARALCVPAWRLFFDAYTSEFLDLTELRELASQRHLGEGIEATSAIEAVTDTIPTPARYSNAGAPRSRHLRHDRSC